MHTDVDFPLGRCTAFVGEFAAIRITLFQLQCDLEKFTRAVAFSDHRATLSTIISENNPTTQDKLDSRHDLKNTASLEKTIVLQYSGFLLTVEFQVPRKLTSWLKRCSYHAENFSFYGFPHQ
ncbi:hypothetical protein TNCV_3058901 [Trichonephila clavipes]|nr:hypothetical protein TNCV_3058901 [Trichonephila clavipes]